MAGMVEAAGQPVRPFRDGLDYAFILASQDAGRVIRSARPGSGETAYES